MISQDVAAAELSAEEQKELDIYYNSIRHIKVVLLTELVQTVLRFLTKFVHTVLIFLTDISYYIRSYCADISY